jgi:hypothetical protein
MQKPHSRFNQSRIALGVATALLSTSLSTQALEFEFEKPGARIDWDSSVSYGLMHRVQSPDPVNANTDDGTNNFDTGVVSNKVSVVSEADFQWGNYGFFVRGKALYDYRYEEQNTDQNNRTYFTDNSGDGNGDWTTDIFGIPVGGSVGDVAQEDFHPDTKDTHGKDAFFLDAFFYGDFLLGDRLLSARLGRQVISWGESQFFPGISGTQTHVDASVAQAPGTELKEIFLPIGQLYGNFEVTPSISVEAYYQYEWKKTKQAAVGSYWSNADTTGDGAERFLIVQEDVPVLGTIAVPFDVIGEDEPEGSSEEAQWGLALRYFMDDGTELGFYRTRYHDKFLSVRSITNESPALPQLAAFPEAIQDYYQQDVDLWGASFTTMVGDFQVNGEISYHEDALPTQQTAPTLDRATGSYVTPDFKTGRVTQGNVGFSYLFGSNPLADGAMVVGEAVYIRTNRKPSDLPEGVSMINTRDAWGYTVTAALNYRSVVSGLDIDIPFSFKHAADGTWKGVSLTEDAKSASIGAKFKYLNNWKADLKYTTFWGSKKTHRNHDRDNISFSVTYSF